MDYKKKTQVEMNLLLKIERLLIEGYFCDLDSLIKYLQDLRDLKQKNLLNS
mgnify:CR=1 FL=1